MPICFYIHCCPPGCHVPAFLLAGAVSSGCRENVGDRPDSTQVQESLARRAMSIHRSRFITVRPLPASFCGWCLLHADLLFVPQSHQCSLSSTPAVEVTGRTAPEVSCVNRAMCNPSLNPSSSPVASKSTRGPGAAHFRASTAAAPVAAAAVSAPPVPAPPELQCRMCHRHSALHRVNRAHCVGSSAATCGTSINFPVKVGMRGDPLWACGYCAMRAVHDCAAAEHSEAPATACLASGGWGVRQSVGSGVVVVVVGWAGPDPAMRLH